jgi:nucleotide-binding universal stress UspA family protein
MSNILLTTDFSDESKRAFKPARELAEQLGLGITLLTVVQDLKAIPHGAPLAPPQSSPELEQEVADAQEAISKTVQELGEGSPVETLVVTGEDVAKKIAETAEQTNAAFVAMSTHGRSGFRHLVLGSVTEEVIQHSKVPVICYPPPSQPS